MSVLARLKSLPANLPTGSSSKQGLTGFALDKGERFLGAAGMGFWKGYAGDKFYVGVMGRQVGYDVLGGGLGMLLTAGLYMFGGSKGHLLAEHVERFSDSALAVAAASWGAKKGLEQAGRSVAVLSPGKNVAPLPAGRKQSVVGASAMGGAYLSAEEIANYAARR
jgi:hypothetical protein